MLTTKSLIVKNKMELYALQNHEPGEIAMCMDTNAIYVWDEDKGWTQISIENKGFEMNLYDLNKNVMNQLEPLNSKDIVDKMDLINEYYFKANNKYHMLLCKDFNYYTIFARDSLLMLSDFADAIITIITELGDVYSIELLEDGAMEIWIKPTGEKEPYVFYLFPYDGGVVYYG